MTSSPPSAFRKYCAAFVAATLALQPLGLYAAPLASAFRLSEIPIQGLNPVKPNIMYTMDDSFSMLWSFMPDFIRDSATHAMNYSWCRVAGAVAKNGGCGDDPASAVSTSLTSPPFASSNFNKIYYDPSIEFIAGVSDLRAALPYESTSPGTWTSVYVDGFAGYPGSNSGGTINLTTNYPDEVYCWKNTPSAADLATAKIESGGDGSVCRRNGTAYPSATVGTVSSTAIAAGWNYPNGVSLSCPDSASTKCVFPFRQAVLGNPYYYTISNIQFCTAIDANDWGAGTCGSRWLPSQPNVSYGAGGFDPTVVRRVDIVPSTPTYPSGRTYAAEMANFAKWYAFNHTRVLATKTAGGFAFSALNDSSRVGFNTINSYLQNFLNIKDFTASNKSTWFSNFYGVVPSGSTPTIDAMFQIGQYFSNLDTTVPVFFGRPRPALPGAVDPLDPVTGRCQSNYHLLSTDGFWNQFPRPYTGVAGAIDNQDLTVPSLPNLPGATGFTPGQPFPLPFREGPDSVSGKMADVAMYYWIHDLRPELADNVKDATAPWQHVTFYGLSIGAEGTLPFPTGINDITSGAKDWPAPGALTPETTDDLWHAAINGHGQYFNVQNAQQLAESVVSALADFTADQSGTGTAVGLAGAQLTATRSFGYRTSYESGWSGDVKKYALDPNTGALPIDGNGNPANPPVWSAGPLLDTMAAGAGWDTNRRIVTINNVTGAAVAFRFANLSGAQRSSLNAGYTQAPIPTGGAVLDYLRGDKSNEGTGSGRFRVRTHILGDIVGSGAVPVGAPGLPYDDAGNPGYVDFARTNRSRTPTVYVGSNDGMLHALNDSATVDAGKETWAYVPKALFTAGDPNDMNILNSPQFQIGALSFRRGGIPNFEHEFYVNATPRVWDIDFANTNPANATPYVPPTTGNDWRTLLVGGLGAGARSVYALDVTTPVALTDTEVAVASSNRVLWEFTDANLGYVFDAPTLVKTRRYGWVVLVASGYNNPGGKGFLYVLNPTSGAILKKMTTGIGSDTEPSGLSTIRAFTASRKDPYVLQAYGGDLKGNVWRFDLSDPDSGNWRVELIAHLKDGGGKDQPITTGVRIEIDQISNVDRLLFVGTGKLLNRDDLADTSVQSSLYVIKDGTRTTPDVAPSTPYSRAVLTAVDGTQVTGFSGSFGRGWYQDAPSDGSRIVTDVIADVQTVVWVTSKPSSDPCDATLTSTLYARDYLTGNSVLESTSGTIVASIGDIGAIAGVTLIQSQGGASGSTGDVRIQVTTMKGQVFSFGVRPPGGTNSKHRVSWRLLNRE